MAGGVVAIARFPSPIRHRAHIRLKHGNRKIVRIVSSLTTFQRRAGMDGIEAQALVWNPPVWREILRWPLPYQGPTDRILLKSVALVARRHVAAVRGLEHMRPGVDPFILVANHASRREAMLLPTVLMLHRGGRLIHFLADWNFRLIPGVGFFYRRTGTITVTNKPARPRFLNVLKPLFDEPVPALDRAREHLLAGRPVGIFPEGTVNRDPARLLAGRPGAARLSLETGVPVIPIGLRFPQRTEDRLGPMDIEIGAPLQPPPMSEAGTASIQDVRLWHAAIMTEIARLSGKSWTARKGEMP
jgi:1-acyl-sn-glycerol-3-phosphate acyltransferase